MLTSDQTNQAMGQVEEILELSRRRGKEIEFVGNIRVDLVKQELVPHPTSPFLMDVAEVSYVGADFKERSASKKRARWIDRRYTILSLYRPIEQGTYLDKR